MPETWTPLKLRSANEGIIFEGEASGAGGGSMPVQADYNGGGVATTIGNGAQASLPWVLVDGTPLLDLTSPTAPTFLASGTYAWAVTVACGSAITAGGSATVGLNNPYIEPSQVIPGGIVATQFSLNVSICFVYHFDAGDAIGVVVANDDGVASRDFLLDYASLVKLA